MSRQHPIVVIARPSRSRKEAGVAMTTKRFHVIPLRGEFDASLLAQRTNLGRTSVRFAKLIKLDRGKERKNTSRGASEGAPTFNFVLLTERCYYVETVHCAELLSSAPAYSSLSSAGSLSRPWLTSILLPPPSHLSYGCVLTISPQVIRTCHVFGSIIADVYLFLFRTASRPDYSRTSAA